MRGLVAASVRKLRGMFHGSRRGRVVAVGDDSLYLYTGKPPTFLELLCDPTRTVNSMSAPEATVLGPTVETLQPSEPCELALPYSEPWFYCI